MNVENPNEIGLQKKPLKKNTQMDHMMAIIENNINRKCIMERNCFEKDKDK